ncbi:MAG: bifunctional 4-hydroxy-2-oxoglutarate aldolase/2-dehydro-3-deoxy-phosphogluconate aldolase [Pedosphaera sp.]|nr:bifunctional 4-hydroxy-2-oxoglutarate aldolase/2-dehydro-3-deoxy-phosphogluconate aldolase [Pedosphaera sp.]
MRSLAEIHAALLDPGLIAVVRTKRRDQVIPLTRALLSGGIRAIEITMTTPEAIAAIREACQLFGNEALIGVGTVLDAATAHAAMDAGAEFVVSPITKHEIAQAARARQRPVLLGALTPTEAQTAYEAGADYIKLFPAEGLRPSYIKALLAPLPHLKIIPTGGVDLANIMTFFEVGCSAVGLGSSLITPAILATDDWAALKERAQEMVRAGGLR